ncbi:MAG: serine/threonine-protein kinase [Chloroflexota bacterium]
MSDVPQVINDRYEIIKELGQGGMGTVFLARDTTTGQRLAIKKLTAANLDEEATLERFRREAEALRQLDHPNIVKALDVFEDDGAHYMALEYMDGGDLSDVLRQGRFPLRRVLEIALDLTDALIRAHRLNIIHRDIKPANVLLSSDGQPRLSDFGVAHMGNMEGLTETGIAVGTLYYMSPETLGESKVDERVDIWAFGIMLYQMVTGKLPYDAETPAGIITAILQQQIPDVTNVRPGLPTDLGNLLSEMLEKDPEKRLNSMRMVGARLEGILRNLDAAPSEADGAFMTTSAYRRDEATPPLQVFVSMRPEDDEAAQHLIDQFQFYDVDVIANSTPPSDNVVWEALLAQIREADRVVVALTPGAMRDPRIAAEAAYARALGKPVLGIAVEGGVLDGTFKLPEDDIIVDYTANNANRDIALMVAFSNLSPADNLPEALPAEPPFPEDGDDTLESTDAFPITKLTAQQPSVSVENAATIVDQKPPPSTPAPPVSEGFTAAMTADQAVVHRDEHEATVRVSATGEVIPKPKEKATSRPNTLMLVLIGAALVSAVLSGLVLAGVFSRSDTTETDTDVVSVPPTVTPRSAVVGTPTVVPLPEQVARIQGRANWIRGIAVETTRNEFATASVDGVVRVFTVENTAIIGEWDADAGSALSIAYNPEGRVIATGYENGNVTFALAESFSLLPLALEHDDAVLGLDYAPDGLTLVTGTLDGGIFLWDLATSELLTSVTFDVPVGDVAFNADGTQIAAGFGDGTVQIFDPEDLSTTYTLEGHQHFVWDVEFSPNPELTERDDIEALLASSSEDGTVRLWDASSGIALEVLRGHTQPVYALAFNPRGDVLTSAGEDATLQFWDVASGVKLSTTQTGQGAVLSVSYTNDNAIVLSGHVDGRLGAWTFRE